MPDIDITPLIDMMFILIIFFVLTTSFIRGETTVALPHGTGSLNSGDVMIVSVLADGTWVVNGTSSDIPVMTEIARNALERGLRPVIAGDRQAPYGSVAELLELFRLQGASATGLLLEGSP
jgi:biopolymer transport protein ExbD